MVKKVAFINFKGGVGKTTLTAEIASKLVYSHNKKVLLVDMDPQTNLSYYFMDYSTWERNVNSNGSLKDLFNTYISGGLSTPPFDVNTIIMKDFYVNPDTGGHTLRNLSLLPAHLEAMGIEADLAFEIGRKAGDPTHLEKQKALERFYDMINILKNALQPVQENYDFIFFDCPPSVGLLTQNALAASDRYVVPAIPDYLSTVGFNFLGKRIDEMRKRVNIALRARNTNNEFRGPIPAGLILTRVRVYRWNPLQFVSPQDIVFDRISRDQQMSQLLFKNFLSESARAQESAEDKIPVAIRSGKKYEDSRTQIENITKEFLARV